MLVFPRKSKFTFSTVDPSPKHLIHQQNGILNAFTGCIIRVINFERPNIIVQLVKEPVLLLRYLSYCHTNYLYPFELGSTYSVLGRHNASTCDKFSASKFKLPPYQVTYNFVTRTLSESFQLKSKNQNCDANIYLYPPSEQHFPQTYFKNSDRESILKNSVATNEIFILSCSFQKIMVSF